jgi:iron complex outermembrane recepter protein
MCIVRSAWLCCAFAIFRSTPSGAAEPAPAAATTQGTGEANPVAQGVSAPATPGATTASPAVPTVVIQATAIPGTEINVDDVPGNVQTLSASDLSREGTPNLTQALETQLASINIDSNLDDAYQPDLLYRGFEASPVLGTPEGLAVYQNGVRINEAFGDAVNWDLFPDFAIHRIDIVSSSPVYGLNALGAGVSVTMKNGFNYQGADAELSGGSFGQRNVELQYGADSGPFGVYLAARGLDDDGWRMFSQSHLRQLYTALSAHTDIASLDLSYTRANNLLEGQGAAPVQELAISRSLVFTGPQNNVNGLNFLTLNGALKVTDAFSLQSVLYYREYSQSVSNGNTTNYASCGGPPYAGDLCQQDGMTPVTNAAGQILPDISDGGAIPIGENDYEEIHAYGRGGSLQATDAASVLGLPNHFAVGATVDYAKLGFFSGTQVGVIDNLLLVLPSPYIVDTPESSPAGAEFGATPVFLKAFNKYYGFYLTDTLDLTSALSLTASGRYNIANIDLEDQLGTNLTGNNRYTHFNPAIGGTYKLLPTVTAYAGFSENNRTPDASEIECSNPLQPCLLPSNLAGDPPILKQVVAHTIELGLRGTFPSSPGASGVLSWNASVFQTNLYNDIYGIATSVSSGFFANIGSTRRAGVELGLKYQDERFSSYFNYSYIDASFRSALLLNSPSNPFQNAAGNIQVEPGDRLPGIPLHRFKMGFDYQILPQWSFGASLIVVTDQYYFGDESNQLAPMPGYHVVDLSTKYSVSRHLELFVSLDNLLDAKYATYGILSDPTGIGAPGIPPGALSNGPGVDNRFESPADPFAAYAGFHLYL